MTRAGNYEELRAWGIGEINIHSLIPPLRRVEKSGDRNRDVEVLEKMGGAV